MNKVQEANVDLVAKFLEAINSLVENSTNEIKRIKDEVAETYKDDFDASIEELGRGNPQAIQGAPVQKVFTDVVNNKIAAGLSPVKTDNKQAPKYDLNGKLITGDLQPGQIYIQNGKKYVNTQK